jgi:hypothetical protein
MNFTLPTPLYILSHTNPHCPMPSVTHQCPREQGIILLDNTKKYGLKRKNGQDQLHLAFECILYANSNRLLRSQSFIGRNKYNYHHHHHPWNTRWLKTWTISPLKRKSVKCEFCLKKGRIRTVSLPLARNKLSCMGRHCSETGVTLDGGQRSSREHRTNSNLFRYFTELCHLLNLCATKCDAVGSLRTLNLGRRARKKPSLLSRYSLRQRRL